MAGAEKSKDKSLEFMVVNVKSYTMSGGKMSLSDTQNLLNDPNIMIVDSGATCDQTALHRVIINMKIAGSEDTIKADNRE